MFTPDGRGLVSGSEDNTLKHWDVSRLVDGPSDRQNSQEAQTYKDVGTREGDSTCTMNFVGHKVRVELADWMYLIVGCRTVYVLSLSRMMANGW